MKTKFKYGKIAVACATAAIFLMSPVTASAAEEATTPATQGEEVSQSSGNSGKLKLSLTRTDKFGDEVHVGDKLTYSVDYRNNDTETWTAFPRQSNLENVLTTSSSNCRWANLAAGKAGGTCTTANHIVTSEDLEKGSFTASVTYARTADTQGTQILEDGITAVSDAVKVVEGETIDPSTVPTVRSDGEPVSLAVSGQGFDCYRIPALAEAPNGWILAIYDGRAQGCPDAPSTSSLVIRTSKDGGKSFEPARVLDAGKTAPVGETYGYTDPSIVVDEVTNEIFVFSVKSYDRGWGNSQAGTDPNDRKVIQMSVRSSKDNGLTWGETRVITPDVTASSSWTSRFASSGQGIQLQYGSYKGRLIQQALVNNEGVHQAVSVYSDDHGATWKVGNPVGIDMDENKVVELSDGSVMLNSRPLRAGYRKVTISNDGGVNYGEVREEKQLPDVADNASIIRAFPHASEGSSLAKVLLYSSASGPSQETGNTRLNGLVRISFDDGKTWSAGKLFKSGRMDYSTLTSLSSKNGGGYGLLYEDSASWNIDYTHISLDWLGYIAATASAQETVRAGKNEVHLQITNLGSHDYENLVIEPQIHMGSPTTKSLMRNQQVDEQGSSEGSGWMAESVRVSSLPAGKSVSVPMTVYVSDEVKEGDTAQFNLSVSDEGLSGVPGELQLVMKASQTDEQGSGVVKDDEKESASKIENSASAQHPSKEQTPSALGKTGTNIAEMTVAIIVLSSLGLLTLVRRKGTHLS